MTTTPLDSFQTRSSLSVGERTYTYWSLPKLAEQAGDRVARLPVSLRVLLENLLRREDGRTVRRSWALYPASSAFNDAFSIF